MKYFAAALFATLTLAGPAKAQDWQYLYATMLGPNDFVNSSGARLGTLCAIVQQDRANYHRFGRREQNDGGDPYFTTSQARARIPDMCRLADGYDYIRRDVLNGTPRYVGVYGRFGANGRLRAILITEGAG